MNDQFIPGSWAAIEAATQWHPKAQRIPSFNDVLKARIRFNEELRQYMEEERRKCQKKC